MRRVSRQGQRTAMRARIVLWASEGAAHQVTNQARERHTGDDFLAFLRLLAHTYRTAGVHAILDNGVHPQGTRRPRLARDAPQHRGDHENHPELLYPAPTGSGVPAYRPRRARASFWT